MLNSRLAIHLAYCVIVLLVAWLYSLGLDSPFILDDLPNLGGLAYLHDSSVFDADFWAFVSQGNAGPTGRPLALLSFVLQAGHWPDDPAAFKLVNLLMHLLSGAGIYYVLLKCLPRAGLDDKAVGFIALGASALWLAHPLQTASVLYVVQRMAVQSNLMVIGGIAGYLFVRLRPWPVTDSAAGRKALLLRLALLSLITALAFLLATFTKENGALLLLFLLVLETTLLARLENPPLFIWWRRIVLAFPWLLALLAIALTWDHWQAKYELTRDFSASERLLTQGRILWQYLAVIFSPSMADAGLFHQVQKSTGLLSPLTTVIAILAWLVVLVFAIRVRRRWPVIAFAILWYLAAHVIESSILPLEMYFNHRNYLAMLGPLVGLLYALQLASERLRSLALLKWVLLASLFGLYCLQLKVASELWSKPDEMARAWYQAAPQVLRNREFYAMRLANAGPQGGREAAEIYEQVFADSPDAIRAVWLRLMLSCVYPEVPVPTLAAFKQSLQTYRPVTTDEAYLTLMDTVVSRKVRGECETVSIEHFEAVLATLLPYTQGTIRGVLQYHAARIKFLLGDYEAANLLYAEAYDLTGDLAVLYSQAGSLISQAQYAAALERIDYALQRISDNNKVFSGTVAQKRDKLLELKQRAEQGLERQRAGSGSAAGSAAEQH